MEFFYVSFKSLQISAVKQFAYITLMWSRVVYCITIKGQYASKGSLSMLLKVTGKEATITRNTLTTLIRNPEMISELKTEG
jgi:hypothetical protein